jgi:E3 ubiquitin-protein ligase MYCBP2
LERLTIEGRDKDKELIDPKHPFCGKPLEYGMAIFAYYECHKCKSP